MQGKKKWLIGFVAVAFISVTLISQVRAEMGQSFGNLPQAVVGTFETTAASTSTASLGNFAPNQILYGFKTNASSAAGICGLYDTATLGGTTMTQGVFIDEGGEATQYDFFQSSWPAPYKLVTDLTVVVSGATCIVYHDPQ